MFYGALVWDPWLIVSQIICLQCLYYLTLGILMAILVGRMSLVYFFDYSTQTTSTVTGWCVIVAFLLTSLVGAGIMLHLIERAKKCLDFSATLYIIHFFICLIYGGWPSSVTWWIVNGTCLCLMALLGEWLCIKREMREIPISRLRSRVNAGLDAVKGRVLARKPLPSLREVFSELRDHCKRPWHTRDTCWRLKSKVPKKTVRGMQTTLQDTQEQQSGSGVSPFTQEQVDHLISPSSSSSCSLAHQDV